MLIKNNSIHTVEDTGDTIIKTFNEPQTNLNDEWFARYSMFNEETNLAPKLLEWSPERIVMEKLPGEILADTVTSINYCDNPNKFYTVMTAINSLHSKLNKWNAKDQDLYVEHADTSWYNIMIDGDTVKLIEPEKYYFMSFNEISLNQFYHQISDINLCMHEMNKSYRIRVNDHWRKHYEKIKFPPWRRHYII
jgi:RIO-like serine/threonine protein kinase|tara:strand:- start:453 stop:1031 length:579 start_codon:yes stop_codon:yes gene_type:complete